MNRTMLYVGLIGLASISYLTFSSNKEEFHSEYKLQQEVYPIKLKSAYDFAGEALPMENFEVKERLEKEMLVNVYLHASTLLQMKAAARYFPIISEILKEEGIHDDFKYLAVAESSLRNAVSPAGAKGFWQFRDAAATETGLEINKFVDERYHVEKATRSACKYLRGLKQRFGTWTNAAAAYNMGPTAFSENHKSQNENSYYDMNFSEETNRYVFRIVALKEIMGNPEYYGFKINKEDLYEPFSRLQVVQVDSSISDLAAFAHNYNCTYRLLKYYNPWLLKSELPNKSRKPYHIYFPGN